MVLYEEFLRNRRTSPPPSNDQGLTLLKGTTALGMKWKKGVVIAADKRVSAGYLVAGKKVMKVHMLAENIGLCIAGLVADAMALVELMRAELKIYKFENGYNPTVKVAASLLSTIMHNGYRSYQPFYTQLIVAGVDVTGSHVFSLDPSGALLEDEYHTIGSGTYFALTTLDAGYKEGLTEKEAEKLAEKAIRASISRDIATGDGFDIFIITVDGLKNHVKHMLDPITNPG